MVNDVLLLFSHSSHWKDRLFRLSSGCVWSSLDVVLPQEEGEPVYVVGLNPVTGYVSKVPLSNRIVMADRACLMTIPDMDPDPVIISLMAQLNRPFHWRYLLPERFTPKRHRNMKTWSPAELVAWAFEDAGMPLFEYNDQRITLEHFWTLGETSNKPVKREMIKLPPKLASRLFYPKREAL